MIQYLKLAMLWLWEETGALEDKLRTFKLYTEST